MWFWCLTAQNALNALRAVQKIGVMVNEGLLSRLSCVRALFPYGAIIVSVTRLGSAAWFWYNDEWIDWSSVGHAFSLAWFARSIFMDESDWTGRVKALRG